MNKYKIVNAETIQKRIEECDKGISILQRVAYSQSDKELEVTNIAIGKLYSKKETLKQILSNSKPLEEELKKAFSAGMSYGIEQSIDYEKESPQPDLKTYINNLKLDI